MSFATEVAKSVSDLRVLAEIDIGQLNTQWVNIGAGIWYVDAENIYTYVDDTLLDGFTAQEFTAIGSVYVDGYEQTEVDSIAEVTTTAESFYYDPTDRALYVRLENFDEPSLHTITIGVINGFSYDEFTPTGSPTLYEGRLETAPSVSKRRDPLFFGKLSYGGGTIQLSNADGEYDRWGEDYDIYGQVARIRVGYPSLSISEYEVIFTGYVSNVEIGELSASVTIADKRRQLTRPITYQCSAQNALATIQDILTTYFPIVYNSTYFNTTEWAAAQALVDDVVIDMQEPQPAIEVIEYICASVFGLFLVDPDGKFTFKVIDTSATAGTTFVAADILSDHTAVYDPTEVISSIRVGYARDWATTGTQYTYYTYSAEEADVFVKYKTYNQQEFPTALETLSAATAYGTTVFDYTKDVHGSLPVELPLAYYASDVGDIINVEIERATKAMIGTTKSEIVSLSYKLDRVTIEFGVRFV